MKPPTRCTPESSPGQTAKKQKLVAPEQAKPPVDLYLSDDDEDIVVPPELVQALEESAVKVEPKKRDEPIFRPVVELLAEIDACPAANDLRTEIRSMAIVKMRLHERYKCERLPFYLWRFILASSFAKTAYIAECVSRLIKAGEVELFNCHGDGTKALIRPKYGHESVDHDWELKVLPEDCLDPLPKECYIEFKKCTEFTGEITEDIYNYMWTRYPSEPEVPISQLPINMYQVKGHQVS